MCRNELRRDFGNCSNDMNRRALERGDLGASFEPYSNLGRSMVASLILKKCITYFFIMRYRRYRNDHDKRDFVSGGNTTIILLKRKFTKGML